MFSIIFPVVFKNAYFRIAKMVKKLPNDDCLQREAL